MSDKLSGSSSSNPIEYRGYHIAIGSFMGYNYWHEDYDGPEDNRAGNEKTVDLCKAAIDETLDETCHPDAPR